jgi:maltose/maltodextrin transport system substrate-binding protein/arabinogalactan oligomer/maltooligosaccharide transport system substrate-binding protein
LSELAPEFLAETGVELVVEQVADMREQFNIAAPAGEGPDILIGAHDWIGGLVESGLLAPIDLGAKSDQFQANAIAGFTYTDNELYGMPYATESLAFCRNTDLVPDAPATWGEVQEIGSSLVADGTTSAGFVLSGTTYDAYPHNTAFGGYIFGLDENGNYNADDVGLDSEGFIASGSWIDQMVKDGLLPQSTDWDTAHVMFETGDVPFIMAGPWAIERLDASGVAYQCGAFPDSGGPFLGVQGFMVNALSENKLLAETFLTEFVATEDTMRALAEAGNRPSAFTPVFDSIEEGTTVYDFAQATLDAQPMPAIPEMAAVWEAWNNGITLIINQELTPEEALGDAAQQVRDIIAEGS